MPNRIDSYLAALRRELRVKPCFVERILSEIEDHLLEGAEREERRGASPEEAERLVIERFGSAEVVARWWSEVYTSENGATNMWQRFTERARRVVFFAQEEAARLGGNLVGTEHLLLGLVREEDSVAGRILTRLGVSAGAVRAETEKQVTPGEGKLHEDMQLTPTAKRMVDLAYEEAKRLANNYIGTEHLLLGLLLEEEGLGGRVLRSLGCELGRTRAVVEAMQETSPQTSTGTSASPSASQEPTGAWQRFSERARRTISFAKEEAARLGEGFVGTEHLLLGLLRQTDSLAARVLERLGVPLDRVRADIVRQVTAGSANLGPDVPLTPRAKRVLVLATEEAPRASSHSIGTEHLLLGLIREGEGVAARVLLALGVDSQRTRIVIESLPEETPPAADPSTSTRPTGESPRSAAPPAPSTEQPPAATSGTGAPTAQSPPPVAEVPPIPSWLRPGVAPPPPRTPWQKFNERARLALWFAQEEAVQFGAESVETEHLLLGITRDRGHVAAQMLSRLGISPDRIRERIEQQTTRGQRNPEQPLEATPRTRRAIELAYAEAEALAHNYLGPEHLLLGLIREGDGLAARVLMELGATVERTRPVLQAGDFATAPPTGANPIAEVPFWLPPQPAPAAGIPWAKLTERARRVMFGAHEEARRLGNRVVGPDCLLLALAREDNLATRILERLGVSIARLRGEVEQAMRPGPGWSEEWELHPDVPAILELAWEEAQALSHNYLGAEHLLLGLLRQEGRQMSIVLGRLGVSLERVREEIPMVGARWAAIVEARRRLEEAEAAYRALLVG